MNAVVIGSGASVSEDEARRVFTPWGELVTEKGHEIIPENTDYAGWPHFKGRADGHGINSDKKVAPSNDLRWFAQSEPSNRLVSEGGVLAVTSQSQPVPKKSGLDNGIGIHGRDAFSGILLWDDENVIGPQRAHNLVAAHKLGVIHVQDKVMTPAVLRDKFTGEILVTYDKGLKMIAPWGDTGQILGPPTGSRHDKDTSNAFLLVVGDTLIQAYGFDVVALDVATGDLLWKTKVKGQRLSFLPVSMVSVSTCLNLLPHAGVMVAGVTLRPVAFPPYQ